MTTAEVSMLVALGVLVTLMFLIGPVVAIRMTEARLRREHAERVKAWIDKYGDTRPPRRPPPELRMY